MLYIYKLSQTENQGYDTHDSIVVCAKSESMAKKINPYGVIYKSDLKNWKDYSWCNSPKEVSCELIGFANKEMKENSVIITSFNAG